MKPRLTLTEHVELGQALAQVRDELVWRSVQLANAYPKSGPEGVPGKQLSAALEAVDKARCELENALFREYPKDGEVTVYYPRR
ncbi:hypothetical protein [Streptomyces sp. NPDC058548]|uniref:hypothetical protein n=1 Tax=unclassified Streptomyces TaxID=2593676 RepID=UPI00366428E4